MKPHQLLSHYPDTTYECTVCGEPYYDYSMIMSHLYHNHYTPGQKLYTLVNERDE